MNDSENRTLEIVGFNGMPSVECGRALPVARRKSDGMYCVLGSTEDGASATWYGEDEAAAFADAQRWSRLRDPLPMPRSGVPGSDGRLAQPLMVVFADQALLDTAGCVTWPTRFHSDSFFWRHLQQGAHSIRAACGSAGTVEALLDDWGACLKKKYDAMYHMGLDQASLKRVADFMLRASRSRALRWEAYLRYAMAQYPERVRQTFDAFTRNEFPGVAWQTYLEGIKNLSDVLKSVPPAPRRTDSPSSPATVHGKLEAIARCQPIKVERQAA